MARRCGAGTTSPATGCGSSRPTTPLPSPIPQSRGRGACLDGEEPDIGHEERVGVVAQEVGARVDEVGLAERGVAETEDARVGAEKEADLRREDRRGVAEEVERVEQEHVDVAEGGAEPVVVTHRQHVEGVRTAAAPPRPPRPRLYVPFRPPRARVEGVQRKHPAQLRSREPDVGRVVAELPPRARVAEDVERDDAWVEPQVRRRPPREEA